MGSTSRDDPGARGDEPAGAPPRSFLAPAREPIIVAIFVLAGIFEVLSGDPVVHGAVLFAVAGLLSWDAVHRGHEESDAQQPSVRFSLTPVERGGVAPVGGLRCQRLWQRPSARTVATRNEPGLLAGARSVLSR